MNIFPAAASADFWMSAIGFTGSAMLFSVLSWVSRARVFVALTAGMTLASIVLLLGSNAPAAGGSITVLGFLALVVAVVGGGPAASTVLALASRGSVDGQHGGIIVQSKEVLRGGTTIGVLERIAVVAALFAGYPEAIAVLVAIKGVGRFTELDSAEARERFIIGSLASLLWACGAAAIVLLARA
ncbi:hypothetical protein ACL9RL_16615 [Plantibacter sp. Mn2098]|uniref:hypothetical protein n=1 Tax=Plantibacter sp. Mn2098 TaxID=3395266 RepID=UPI003BCC06BE